MSKLLAKKETVLGAKEKQGRFDDVVVSDADLDTLLDDVEKIQANRVQVQTETDVKFSNEDERDLDEIFNGVQRRRREFNELRDAAAQNHESDDDDRSSNTSASTKSSQDSDLDRLIDEVEKKPGEAKRKFPRLNEKMEDEMDKILAEVDGADSKKMRQKTAKNSLKKRRQNSSSSESSDSDHSDKESTNSSEAELNTMVAELLEF